MASRSTLTAESLEALGAARLAELLIEISASDAAVKRRIKLEVAGSRSPGEAAREIGKRLASIAKSRSFVDWHKHKDLVADMDAQRRAIMDHVAKTGPAEALDLLWRFMALAGGVFERSDDSSGALSKVFRAALDDLGSIAQTVKPDPEALAAQTFAALQDNHYGQYDRLIGRLAPILGGDGLNHLKELVIAYSKISRQKPAKKDRVAIGWGPGGAIYADEIEDRHSNTVVRMALEQIADLQGDVDGYIAQQSAEARKVPAVAAAIARRLLAAGRADEAMTAIDAARPRDRGWNDFEWEETRADVLEVLGRGEEAQAFRWSCFTRSMDPRHLRAHLKRLPDFDDVEAEDRALALVLGHEDMSHALHFLITWPSLDKAAKLVLGRAGELDGDRYEILSPAADALEGKHPLAATVLRRSMIDFTLISAKSSRYKHAARHLLECESLAPVIAGYGGFATHEAYVAGLKAQHGRKAAFWDLLKSA